MSCIYTMTQEAFDNGWDWDKIFANNATVIVKEFDTYQEAVEAYENGEYDQDLFGVA